MSINEAADKAAAGALLHGAQQQASTYAPSQGVKAEQVIDYLLVHYWHVIEQNDHMRGRVWQLEAVNDNHLRRSQELCDEVRALRQHIRQLEDELSAAKTATISAEEERNRLLEACDVLREQVGFFKPKAMVKVNATYWGRGGCTLQRELPVTSVQTGQGHALITVDLRSYNRKRVG